MTEHQRNTLTLLTSDLVGIRSIAEQPDRLAATIDYVDAFVRRLPHVFVNRTVRNTKSSLVATLRPTRTPRIIVHAHLDVVAAPDTQFRAQIRDGRIYGRGAYDMKGSAAVMLKLLADLNARSERPDVGFMFTTDEEIGGLDGVGALLNEGWRSEIFISLEPTELDICYVQKGMMRLVIGIPGRAAHGARPWQGENPLAALGNGLVALAQAFPVPAPDSWATTVTPTIVQAGNSENRIPETATLLLDVRYTEADDPADVRARVQHCFPAATVTGEPIAGGMLYTNPADRYVQQLQHCIRAATGHDARLYREHYGSDARFFASAGMPAVCFGPRGANMHADDEYVEIDSLEQVYAALHRFVLA